MTSSDSLCGHPTALHQPMAAQCFLGVLRASWPVTAIIAQQGRDESSVNGDQLHRPKGRLIWLETHSFSSAIDCSPVQRSIQRTNRSKSAVSTRRSAINTYTVSLFRPQRDTAARIRRFALLRTTAEPTLLPATKPTEAGPGGPGPAITVTPPQRRRCPVW